MIHSLKDIASFVEGQSIGDENATIKSLCSLNDITPEAIVLADGKENIKQALNSDAKAMLVHIGFDEPTDKHLIKVKHPFDAFIKLINLFYPEKKPTPTIHSTAVIGQDVIIGENVSIEPYVVIGEGSIIGDDVVLKSHVSIGRHVNIGRGCIIHPQVTIYDNCILKNFVTIHAATVIGSDGFGYIPTKEGHQKIPHRGAVLIEDDVEVGANTVIDKATLGYTKIGRGTKIDNLVQVAHNVTLGQHNILCAFTGISGSCSTGKNVIFAANVGVSDHVTIDDDVVLGARTGVPPKKHLIKGNTYLGSPACLKRQAIEQELCKAYVPTMRKNLRKLTQDVSQLTEYVNTLDKD